MIMNNLLHCFLAIELKLSVKLNETAELAGLAGLDVEKRHCGRPSFFSFPTVFRERCVSAFVQQFNIVILQ